jgi:REP-associated tyrosine transposase
LRFPRVVVPGCPHHVLHRGNRKQNIFCDDSDRLVYLRLMQGASEKYEVRIWAYALMGNHVHFVAVPIREDSLHKTIKVAHGDYTTYFNSKYGLVGHTWQGRFKSFPMDETYCSNAVRYTERNPVRAGIVERAEDYLWSSAAAHCGLRDDLLLSDECPLTRVIRLVGMGKYPKCRLGGPNPPCTCPLGPSTGTERIPDSHRNQYRTRPTTKEEGASTEER